MQPSFWMNFANYIEDPKVWFFALMSTILLIVFYALSQSLIVLTRQLSGAAQAAPIPVAKPKKASAWKKMMKLLTRSVPVEQERDVLLDHDYDGIRELDNQLPPWWKWGFYLTIVFAVVYLFYFHVLKSGHVMANEYALEMKMAEMEKAERMKLASENINDENVYAFTDEHELSEGRHTFEKFCVACHGNAGQGNVGPNLTDDYWLHGGGIKNLFHTITEGVPAKGMISWKTQLTPKQIQEVASFILTLKGSNPPGAKEPQGDRWVETPADSTALSGDKKVIASK